MCTWYGRCGNVLCSHTPNHAVSLHIQDAGAHNITFNGRTLASTATIRSLGGYPSGATAPGHDSTFPVASTGGSSSSLTRQVDEILLDMESAGGQSGGHDRSCSNLYAPTGPTGPEARESGLNDDVLGSRPRASTVC